MSDTAALNAAALNAAVAASKAVYTPARIAATVCGTATAGGRSAANFVTRRPGLSSSASTATFSVTGVMSTPPKSNTTARTSAIAVETYRRVSCAPP